MAETRRYYSSGEPYCSKCKIIRYELDRKTHPTRYKKYQRVSKLRKSYGIDDNDYNELFEQQGKVCAICGAAYTGGRQFHIDHNHDTNEIRGILCHHCNTAIGAFKDDIELLLKAINYIKAGKSKKKG